MDLTGKRFGRLIVLGIDHHNQGVFWKCLCDCGNIKVSKTSALHGGGVLSCGCLFRETRPKGRMENSRSWKGGKYLNDAGYVMKNVDQHPRVQANGYVREHLLIAEKALGKPFPQGVQVHHYGKKSDNTKMILCQDQGYHFLIHMREMAYKFSGDPHKRKCKFCKGWDFPENLHVNHTPPHGWNIHHQSCESEYEKGRLSRKQEKRRAVKGLSSTGR